MVSPALCYASPTPVVCYTEDVGYEGPKDQPLPRKDMCPMAKLNAAIRST